MSGAPEAELEFERPLRLDDEPDARLLDLEPDEESPFLRAQRRVPVRRGPIGRRAASRLKTATVVLALAGVAGLFAYALYHYGAHSWRFRLGSGDDVEIAGMRSVTRNQVMEVFGGDIGRNVFFVPLEQRQRELEQIPWVESATVMRLWPHRISVRIRERTPVAFARVGSRAQLIDANGVLMDLPPGKAGKFSFPVVVGMGEAEPLSTRAARMRIFDTVIKELDSGGAHYSEEVSEMDLADPDDVKVTVADPGGAVLVHLGSSQFLERFRIFRSHLQEWRAQFKKLESVDLRYERQVIVNPDAAGGGTAAAAGTAAPEAAVASGSRPAAAPKRSQPKRAPRGGAVRKR